MPTKSMREPPTERCRQRRFSGKNQKVLPLHGEQARLWTWIDAQLHGKLLLRPRLVCLQAHGSNALIRNAKLAHDCGLKLLGVISIADPAFLEQGYQLVIRTGSPKNAACV